MTQFDRPLSAFAARKARQAAVRNNLALSEDVSTRHQSEEEQPRPKRQHLEAAVPTEKHDRLTSYGLRTSPTDSVALDPAEITEVYSGKNLMRSTPESTADTSTDYASDEERSQSPTAVERIGTGRLGASKPTLSNIGSSKQVTEIGNGAISIVLHENEAISLIGVYSLLVLKGNVTVMGALLNARSGSQLIYAPSTHAILAITHAPIATNEDARIIVQSRSTGLRGLGRLNHMFKNIWNHQDLLPRSFTYLLTSTDDRKSRTLTRLNEQGSWKSLAARFAAKATRNPIILVCGPKGSGKSSFAKYLVNVFITNYTPNSGTPQTVAFLDLDPGQPEYSPPGDVSLLHISETNLGPAYSHPACLPMTKNTIIRSHHIGNTTPAHDVLHYMKCCQDLFARHTSTAPLIVNACGWTHGSGIDMTREILESVPFTDIVRLSNQENDTHEHAAALRSLVKQFESKHTNVHDLACEHRGGHPARELRHMQTMSYFHTELPIEGCPSWNYEPLETQAGQSLRYVGTKPQIRGVIVYGNPINPEDLVKVINGTVLALVAIEDAQITQSLGSSRASEPPPSSIPYLTIPRSLSVGQTLPPEKSRCLCHVLVRGIDAEAGVLRVICPFDLASMVQQSEDVGETLVLVSGRLDVPTWAYTEAYYEAQAQARDRAAWNAFQAAQTAPSSSSSSPVIPDVVEGEDEFGPQTFDVNAWARAQPWIETVHRGAAAPAGTGTGGAKRWKVRRNLGTRRKAGAGAGAG